MVEIHKAELKENKIIAELFLQMWDDNDIVELQEKMKKYIISDEFEIFIAYEKEIPIAVAQCGLRKDYVEGTDSTPVGYLEGIFVEEAHRKKNIAKLLCKECENWVKEKGCNEFASDCELDNENSLKFHLAIGFTEVNRIICFTKKLV